MMEYEDNMELEAESIYFIKKKKNAGDLEVSNEGVVLFDLN